MPIPRLAFLSVVLNMCIALAGLGADAWSPGTSNASWERISRLQSIGNAAAADSRLVTECCRSKDAVERLAAISWIARTQSVRHISELQALLSDSVEQVRYLALEALLVMPHPDAAESVLKAIVTLPDLTAATLDDVGYRRYAVEIVPTHDVHLLERLSMLSVDERRDWTALLLDREEWISQYAQQRKGASRFQVWLSSSVLQRDESLTVVFKTPAKGESRSQPSETLELRRIQDLTRAKDSLTDNLYGRAKLHRTRASAKQEWQYELVAERTPVAPGIYALSPALSDDAPLGVESFPFFIRVNRSQLDELEIPGLLARLPDGEAVERLGVLRVRDAVPQLMEQFRITPPGCEQSEIARALVVIGDGRAAEAFLDQPSLRCQDSSWNVGPLLGELDSAAEPFYAKCIETADDLSNNWESMDHSIRSDRLLSIELSLGYCRRPLAGDQVQRIERLLMHISESVAAQDGPQNDSQYQAGELLVACTSGERRAILSWLAKYQKSPWLYLTTLRTLYRWPDSGRYGVRISSETLDAVQGQLQDWLDQTPLMPDLHKEFTTGLKYLRGSQPVELAAGKPAGEVKQRFGRKYYFDGRWQFWCAADGKRERWGTFCRRIKNWFVLDAETLCVQAIDGSLQVVRSGERVRSWSSSELWDKFDARSRDWLLSDLRIGGVGDNLVVSTAGCLVFVLPTLGNAPPWIVDEPLDGGTPHRPLFEPDPFAEEEQEFAPRPRTINDRARSARPRVWKLGKEILIAADTGGRKTFAIQCVDVAQHKVVWEKVVVEAELQARLKSQGWKPLDD